MPYAHTDPWEPLGYARFGSLATAIVAGTTAPTAGTAYSALGAIPNHAIVSVETQSVRVRDDGTSPTTTEGELIAAGAKQFISGAGAIAKLRIIETTASAAVTVRYYL